MHIANSVLHVGMKPFPLMGWPRNEGQLSRNKLTQIKEGFLPRSRLAEGILIKFPRLLPLNRKSSPLWRTLRLTRKSILIRKQNMWCKCNSSVQAMASMTRIYSVAFPLILSLYNMISELFFVLADVHDSGAGS